MLIPEDKDRANLQIAILIFCAILFLILQLYLYIVCFIKLDLITVFNPLVYLLFGLTVAFSIYCFRKNQNEEDSNIKAYLFFIFSIFIILINLTLGTYFVLEFDLGVINPFYIQTSELGFSLLTKLGLRKNKI